MVILLLRLEVGAQFGRLVPEGGRGRLGSRVARTSWWHGCWERARRSPIGLVGCVTGGVFTLTGSRGEGAPCEEQGSHWCASLSELWLQLRVQSRVHV